MNARGEQEKLKIGRLLDRYLEELHEPEPITVRRNGGPSNGRRWIEEYLAQPKELRRQTWSSFGSEHLDTLYPASPIKIAGEGGRALNAAELAAALGKPHREGRGWKCLCPCHADTDPSLSLVEREGRVLAICRAGCDQAAVVDELKRRGLWPNGHERSDKPRIIGTYAYADESGKLLFEVCRLRPKSFRQRWPDGAGGWI
jgi:hypothetical protein